MPELSIIVVATVFTLTLIAGLGWSIGCWLWAAIVGAVSRRRG